MEKNSDTKDSIDKLRISIEVLSKVVQRINWVFSKSETQRDTISKQIRDITGTIQKYTNQSTRKLDCEVNDNEAEKILNETMETANQKTKTEYSKLQERFGKTKTENST